MRRKGAICAVAAMGLGAVLPQLSLSQALLASAPDATVVRFDAVLNPTGTVAVRWQSQAEEGRVVYAVRRTDASGAAGLVGRRFAGESAARYELLDSGAAVGKWMRYELLLMRDGATERTLATWDGIPRKTTATAFALAAAPVSLAASGPVDGRADDWIGVSPRVGTWTNAAPADAVRLSLRQNAVYHVTAQELASAFGLDSATLAADLAAGRLALECQQTPIPWMADGSNLLFYGQAPTSAYAPENVYWVRRSSGAVMTTAAAPAAGLPGTNGCFLDLAVLEGTNGSRVNLSTLLGRAVPNLYGYIFPPTTTPVDDSRTTSLALPDCATGAWNGTLRVQLLSCYEGLDTNADWHHAIVSSGATVLGEPIWPGEACLSTNYPFASSLISNGMLSVTLMNALCYSSGSAVLLASPRFLWTTTGVLYPRQYRARNGCLRCTGGTLGTVLVVGFATNDLAVWDITQPGRPAQVAPLDIHWDAPSASWAVSFACGGTDAVYCAFSRSTAPHEPAVRGARLASQSSSANAADYVILIPPEAWCKGFREALQPLADYRNAQGVLTRIVDIETLYNAYSDGLVDPEAIHAFCADGYAWPAPHRLGCVLLAGHGSADYRHLRYSVNDSMAALIPSRVDAQCFEGTDGELISCDTGLGDVAGDLVPEVVVARLPTTSTNDLKRVVQKTIAYEATVLRTNTLLKAHTLLLTDWANSGNNGIGSVPTDFAAGAQALLDPLARAGRILKTCFTVDNDDVANQTTIFKQELRNGDGLFHFFGHGGPTSLGGQNRFFYYYTITPSAFGTNPTIFTASSCNVCRWQMINGPNIGTVGLFATDTGFAAAIGSTGFMYDTDGDLLGQGLYGDSSAGRPLRVGDAFKSGLRTLVAHGVPTNRVHGLTLIGDPLLVWRQDLTAARIPTTWLVQAGLSAPNADLDVDWDGDGWPTGLECLSGTNPTGNTLRVASLATAGAGRLAIGFETVSNLHYQVACRNSLLATDTWQAVSWARTNAPVWNPAATPVSADAPITHVDIPLEAGQTQRFYRIERIP